VKIATIKGHHNNRGNPSPFPVLPEHSLLLAVNGVFLLRFLLFCLHVRSALLSADGAITGLQDFLQ
jgi:hypothetical protein